MPPSMQYYHVIIFMCLVLGLSQMVHVIVNYIKSLINTMTSLNPPPSIVQNLALNLENSARYVKYFNLLY